MYTLAPFVTLQVVEALFYIFIYILKYDKEKN